MNSNSNKKSATTNNKYQSTFMPIFQEAEAKIKRLIVFAFWVAMLRPTLLAEIATIIKDTAKKIPNDLKDKDKYIKGLKQSSFLLVKKFDKMSDNWKRIRRKADVEIHITPQKMYEEHMWSQAKAAPYMQDYNKKLKEFVKNTSDQAFTVTESDKKHPISLWQKAEIDVRHEKQMQMLDDCKRTGSDLWWISSHPDCSERCEKFQGELVSLSKHAKAPQKKYRKYSDIRKDSFVCDHIDGHKVYSLSDITSCTDKYGYNNMIISGFNCRHHLIEYRHESVAPKSYSNTDIKKERAIEQRIRQMERNIRLLKTRLNNSMVINDTKTVSKLKQQIKFAVNEYKRYCDVNGYAWYDYRIRILKE